MREVRPFGTGEEQFAFPGEIECNRVALDRGKRLKRGFIRLESDESREALVALARRGVNPAVECPAQIAKRPAGEKWLLCFGHAIPICVSQPYRARPRARYDAVTMKHEGVDDRTRVEPAWT